MSAAPGSRRVEQADHWFRATRHADGVRWDGLASTSLGHRIARTTPPDEGAFVSWHWDGTTLVVESDRFGAYPLFVHVSDERILVSPSLLRVLELGAPPDLDEGAVAAFLALGYFLGSDTAFRGVWRLPGASRLTWSAAGWQLEVGERLSYQVVGHPPRAALIDEVIERFRASISRRLDGAGCIMPISGGRDSRHILLELHAQGAAPRLAVTAHKYPFENDLDAEYAARLCAAIGQPHRTLPQPGPMVVAEQRKNVVTHMTADEHAWTLPVREALMGETYTYDGLGGGTFLDRPQAGRPRLRAIVESGDMQAAAAHMIKTEGGSPRYLELIAASKRATFSPERAAARIARELEQHRSTGDPLAAFIFANRVMGEIALSPFGNLSVVPVVHTPFLDRDLVDYLTGVPTEAVDYALHNEILERAYPRVRGVPVAPTGPPATVPGPFLRRLHADLARLLARSPGALLDRGPLLRRCLAGAVRPDDWITRGRRATLIVYLAQLEGLGAAAAS